MKTPDTRRFIKRLKQFEFFSPSEIFVSRAPGRIDLMGGIADYSGALVLQWPIAAATHVAVQLQDTPAIEICSLASSPKNPNRSFEMGVADFESNGAPVEYTAVGSMFQSDRHWAAYVAGAFLVLMRERDCRFKQGAKILIGSEVPEGKGVSSSAALEVAAMMAIAAAYNIEISPVEVAFLSQKVENLIAGAPCGVMDQMTAACGESDRLLALLCQPGELQGTISLPDELAIWGLDSGIRHSVAGVDYGVVRTAAFMGLRIITELGRSDPRGYLANITPDEFDKNFATHLPHQMAGEGFLKRYGRFIDSVTSVDPGQTYPVFAATRHPVYEHARVKLFARSLQNWKGPREGESLGDLMYESHESYSACGLGSSGTDELVRLVRDAGPERGLYGAKITGGGSGGTVAVLGQRSAVTTIGAIAKRYAQRSGHQPLIISGSSAGAGQFGVLKL
ncbi:MAG TPA: galactokinase family protein [Pyrinomonadaceae bacterium]|jgi:L-arabinokinase